MNGLRVNYNEQHNGIELFFDKPPSAEIIAKMKEPEHRFYWSIQEKKWYGKRTPEREAFVQNVLLPLYGQKEQNAEKKIDDNDYLKNNREKAAKEMEAENPFSEPKKKNTFGEFYKSIGNARIYPDSSLDFIDFRNSFHDGYFKDLNVYVWLDRDDRFVKIVDLTNATSRGKNCAVYHLNFEYLVKGSISSYLSNELKVKTMADLFDLIKGDKNLGDLNLQVSEKKGIEVFSPFQEVEPLKNMPDNWTRTHLQRALMSGQIYNATMAYSYTDDYAFDASENFKKGKKVDIPSLAKETYETWNSRALIGFESKDAKTAVIHLTESNSSMNLMVDLECNIEESLKRMEAERVAVKEYNEEITKDLVGFSDIAIKPNAFYTITYLEKNNHTGKYDEKQELVQGAKLVNREGTDFKPWYALAKEINHLTIEANKLYQVSSFNHYISFPMSNELFIPIGNREIVVSGQALKELATQVIFPYVSETPSFGCTFANAREELQAFIDGTKYWNVDVSKVNYQDSLERLNREEERVHNIMERKSNSNLNAPEQKPLKTDSLFDRINKIEAERKTQVAARGTQDPRISHGMPTKER